MTELQPPHTAIETPQKLSDGFPFPKLFSITEKLENIQEVSFSPIHALYKTDLFLYHNYFNGERVY